MGKRTAINITKADIAKLKPGKTVQRLWDLTTRGLGIQVTPAGAYSWILSYRINGIKDSTTVGRWPEMTIEQARKAALPLWEKINAKENPNQAKAAAREEARNAITVSDLADRFMKEHMMLKNKPSTILVHGDYIQKDIKPKLGRLKVKAVTKADIAEFLFSFQSEGKTTKAYTLSRILSKMFAKAEIWGLRQEGSNPARGQECQQGTKRERRLTDKELSVLGKVLKDSSASPYALAAIRLYLLVGMRLSELVGNIRNGIPPLTWDQVDREKGIIRLDLHKTSRRVGARFLFCCAAARQVLDGLYHARMINNPCVIPGSKPGRAYANMHGIWDQIQEETTIKLVGQREFKAWQKKGKGAAPIGIMDVTLHDLRRTFISMAADLGLPDYFAEAQTGHAPTTVTDTYRRVGSNPLFEAVEAIGARIEGMLSGTLEPSVDVIAGG